AIGGIVIAPGSALTANAFSMILASCGPMNFDRVNIRNILGELTLSTLGNLTLNKGTVAADSGGLPSGTIFESVHLNAGKDVNICGHTLVFENVNFAGNPNLQSDVGLLADNPNTRQATQRGYVNFFDKVTYDHNLITSANQDTYVNPFSGSGIHISPRVH